MSMRRATKFSSRMAGVKTPISSDDRTLAASPKRVTPPLIEQFHVAVDRRVKSGYRTYEAADKVARAIKKRYPQLQVTIFDAKQQRHTTIEQPDAGVGPRKKPSDPLKSTSLQRSDVSGDRR